MRRTTQFRKSQTGAVAIVVGVSLAVLVGFAGLALDLGRLYINKTELQNAADACALAAAGELTCDPSVGPCPASKLHNAENAGIFAAGKNSRDFQNTPVTVAANDVRFSVTLAPNSAYSSAGSASPDSKYAMCIAHSTGIVPWFMGVLGLNDANIVSALAVATLAPSQEFCSSAPIGICANGNAPSFGHSIGDWIESKFTSAGDDDLLEGNFRWIDFTIQAGGNSEIRDQLAGGRVCNLRVGQNVEQAGTQQGAKAAYNTRFGMYKNGSGYVPAPPEEPKNGPPADVAPPDRSGYAYPNKSPGSPVIAIGASAYGDYLRRQGLNSGFAFDEDEYGIPKPDGNMPPGDIATPAQYKAGGDRRIVAVPIVSCSAGKTTPILGMACALMLNPMSNGASGTIYLEYRGVVNSSAPAACRSMGLPGDAASSGPRVPALVQ